MTEFPSLFQSPARTVADVFRTCNPNKPLVPDDPRYVDLTESRGPKQLAASVTRRIQRSAQDAKVKLLFTGHRGSGKTTELLRLQKELEDKNFFTVYMDVEDLLDTSSLSYLDVLVSLVHQVQEQCSTQKVSLSKELLENISSWFNEHIVEETHSTDYGASVQGGAKGRLKIPWFGEIFSKITTEIKSGSTRRTIIRKKLGQELSIFIQHLNHLLANAREALQAKGFQDLVLIVDGMEKMHYELNPEGISSHTELFIRHAEQLRSPECHIIYTVPISLAYNQSLGTDFDNLYVLPMVRLNPKGIATLKEVIAQRVDIQAVFSAPNLLQQLIRTSGGVVRDLMRLMQMASDTDEEQITKKEVSYAINALRKEYDRLIRSSDIAYFRTIKENKRIQGGDEEAGRVLNLRLVLEYEDQNGDRSAALHPAVAGIPWVKKSLLENAS
jgi:DNA polymerase III delta prime subunit